MSLALAGWLAGPGLGAGSPHLGTLPRLPVSSSCFILFPASLRRARTARLSPPHLCRAVQGSWAGGTGRAGGGSSAAADLLYFPERLQAGVLGVLCPSVPVPGWGRRLSALPGLGLAESARGTGALPAGSDSGGAARDKTRTKKRRQAVEPRRFGRLVLAGPGHGRVLAAAPGLPGRLPAAPGPERPRRTR